MTIEKLLKIEIVGLQKNKISLLDFLHTHGSMHIESFDSMKNSYGLKPDSHPGCIDNISESLLELKWLEENLPSSKKGVPHFPFLHNKLTDVLSEAKKLRRELHNTVSSLVHFKQSVQEKVDVLNDKLVLLSNIPFDLEFSSLPYISEFTFAYLVKDLDYDSRNPSLRIVELFKGKYNSLSVIQKNDFALIQGSLSSKNSVEKKIKSAGIQIMNLPCFDGSRNEYVKNLHEDLSVYNIELKNTQKKLVQLSKKYLVKIQSFISELTIFYDRYAISNNFATSDQTFYLEGFLPKKSVKDLKEFSKKVKVDVVFEEPKDAPTKLKNLPYVRHFEFITKMFGLPSYKSVDPTIYISLFLPFFFGFMFSDVGYGLILLAIGSTMILKSNAHLKILKDAGIVMITNAFSTILFGLFFGSFFGNLIKIDPWLFDPFSNAKLILVAALGIGLVHLNLGVFISMYESLRKNDIKKIFTENISILLLQTSVVFMLLGQKTLGFVLLSVSIGLFILKGGFMGIMDITGFAGTWFSYARLLALSLATGGIALGVNIMATQLQRVALFGPVLFGLLLIFGHLFNFVMNLLGSSIHSVRLHYIEFFSQFYEANGKPFVSYDTLRIKDKF